MTQRLLIVLAVFLGGCANVAITPIASEVAAATPEDECTAYKARIDWALTGWTMDAAWVGSTELERLESVIPPAKLGEPHSEMLAASALSTDEALEAFDAESNAIFARLEASIETLNSMLDESYMLRPEYTQADYNAAEADTNAIQAEYDAVFEEWNAQLAERGEHEHQFHVLLTEACG